MELHRRLQLYPETLVLAVGIMDRFLAPIKVQMAALVRVVAELLRRAGVWPSLGKVRCPDSSSLIPRTSQWQQLDKGTFTKHWGWWVRGVTAEDSFYCLKRRKQKFDLTLVGFHSLKFDKREKV